MSVAATLENIRIRFGEPETALQADATGLQLNLASPHLAGPLGEVLFECENVGQASGGNFSLLRGGDGVAGMAVVDCGSGGIEPATKALYDELLERTAGLNLYRLWNFVPRINEKSRGQENYHCFNSGRWKAFAEVYGEAEMHSHLSAASAVGLEEARDRLAVVFVAGTRPVEFFENPRQTPAYQYPREFGPCSPSFSRGSVVAGENRRVGYLSGTSSICGHKTVGLGDLEKQFSETVANIGEALKRMGFAGWPGQSTGYSSQFRVYVRDAADYPAIRQWFGELVGEEVAGQTVFIQADICRKPLKLEIEGVFRELPLP